MWVKSLLNEQEITAIKDAGLEILERPEYLEVYCTMKNAIVVKIEKELCKDKAQIIVTFTSEIDKTILKFYGYGADSPTILSRLLEKGISNLDFLKIYR